MPPIHMTRRERATLVRLAYNPIPIGSILPDHAEKFVNHGLAINQSLQLRITQKGQLEILRQRFRGMSTRRTVQSSSHDFISRFEQSLKNGFSDRPVRYAMDIATKK